MREQISDASAPSHFPSVSPFVLFAFHPPGSLRRYPCPRLAVFPFFSKPASAHRCFCRGASPAASVSQNRRTIQVGKPTVGDPASAGGWTR